MIKKLNTKIDTKTKLKILIARIEVAGQSFMTYKSLRHLNSCHVTQLIYSESSYSYEYDKNLGLKKHNKNSRNLIKFSNVIKIIHFMIHEFMKYDVYHFHFGISMLPLNMDIFFLKLFRSKKVFVEFHGSDIRANLTGSILNKIKTLLRRFRNNILMNVSNGIIVHDYELLNYIPNRHLIKTLILPLRIDTDNYIESKSDSVKRISHTPSNRSGKGTSIIQNIINELPLTDLKYDFKINDNLTQSEIKKILSETHILIDQIITGTYGVLSCEGMASGNIVITYINEMYLNMFPKSLPIISADKDNLGKILLKVLDNKFNDSSVKKKSVEYVKRYHNYKNLGTFLLNFYQIQNHNGPLNVFKLIDANIGEEK